MSFSKCVCAMLSCSIVSNSLQPHGLQPARLLCRWEFSRQEYWSGLPGVGCHDLLQGIFPSHRLNPGLPHCRWILYHLSPQGIPWLSRFCVIFYHPLVHYLILLNFLKGGEWQDNLVLAFSCHSSTFRISLVFG